MSDNRPTYDDIAQLAYDRYLARGAREGSDLEDWLAAEQEVQLRRAGIPAWGAAASAAVESVRPAPGGDTPAITDGTSRPRRRDRYGNRGVAAARQLRM